MAPLTIRAGVVCAALAGLAACTPTVPASNPNPLDSGVDYNRYNDLASYRAGREAELTGQNAPLSAVPQTVLAPSDNPAPSTGDPTLDAAAAALGATGPTATATLDNPDISDEQDFDAVSGRETIASDAERLRQQREQRTVIQPTAVPTRTSTGPNIVAFALATSHPVGQKVYPRNVFSGEARLQRNCSRYAADDLAQQAFLEAGGPERDRLGVDPDGDGYACGWNPAPFRRAAVASGS